MEKDPHKCLYAHIRADANVKGKLVELCSEVRSGPRAAQRRLTGGPRIYDCYQGIVVQEFNPCNDQPGVVLLSCGEIRKFWQAPDTRHVWLRPMEDKSEKVQDH